MLQLCATVYWLQLTIAVNPRVQMRNEDVSACRNCIGLLKVFKRSMYLQVEVCRHDKDEFYHKILESI